MADASNSVPVQTDEADLPVAAIVVIAIGAYLVLIVILLIIRQILMQRGICGNETNWCGKEGELGCCQQCCISCGETCNCCGNPSVEACLDSLCPSRRQMECADIIMCQCCADPNNPCCNSSEPLCDCGNCDCVCNCQPQECDKINCCCFEVNLKTSDPNAAAAGGYGQGYPPGGQMPPHMMAGYGMPPHGYEYPPGGWQGGLPGGNWHGMAERGQLPWGSPPAAAHGGNLGGQSAGHASPYSPRSVSSGNRRPPPAPRSEPSTSAAPSAAAPF